ncbi:hypothetical protein ABI_34260 [Asticcacaulis biprosthecium C19]|uniref:Uncharacterized protein n=1 Tax=Asticcacaulis biprosthecium C19 TaxID=715226 RepID=F4QQB8_9CAUL|nr:hypothetical protein ABI_34260 [Asticcacaulis biprosthecium C19]
MASFAPVAAFADAIPTAFHGNWSQSQATCNDPNEDTHGLTITPNALSFYELQIKVAQVTDVAPGYVKVEGTYRDAGDTGQIAVDMFLSTEDSVLALSGDLNSQLVRCRGK